MSLTPEWAKYDIPELSPFVQCNDFIFSYFIPLIPFHFIAFDYLHHFQMVLFLEFSCFDTSECRKYTKQLPIGFARIPPQQFQTMRGLRKYIMGIKCYNEWGYYYVRRSGRFCDAKALQIMFGDDVMGMLDEQRLVKPITLPPEVMDNELFPPTNYKKIETFEAAKAKYNPMPMEEGFFAKLNFYKIWNQNRKEKKRWKRKEKLLAEWRADGKSDDDIVLLLKEEGLLDVENRSLVGKEEFADFDDKNASKTLKQHPVFQELLRFEMRIYFLSHPKGSRFRILLNDIF